jgi:hypothetical protein
MTKERFGSHISNLAGAPQTSTRRTEGAAMGDSTDPNVEAVRRKLLERSAVGVRKYGTTTARDDLSLRDWLVHLQEELMDAAVYIEAALSANRLHDDAATTGSDDK